MKNPVIEPFWKIPGALEDLRQQIEDARRVALLAGRLARRQADLALRHGQPRHRIHHQQHALSLIAKIFRHRQRHERRANPQRRGHVGSRHHHHAALQALRAQFLLEKIAHLAVALADQRDHADVGRIVPRHRAQQRALAHARAAEDPDALPFAEGQQTVDRADAGHQRLRDVLALQRSRRRGVKIVGGLRHRSPGRRPSACRIRRARGPAVAAPTSTRAASGRATTGRPVAARRSLRAASAARGRRESPTTCARTVAARVRLNLAEIADRRRRAVGGHQQSHQLADVSGPVQRLESPEAPRRNPAEIICRSRRPPASQCPRSRARSPPVACRPKHPARRARFRKSRCPASSDASPRISSPGGSSSRDAVFLKHRSRRPAKPAADGSRARSAFANAAFTSPRIASGSVASSRCSTRRAIAIASFTVSASASRAKALPHAGQLLDRSACSAAITGSSFCAACCDCMLRARSAPAACTCCLTLARYAAFTRASMSRSASAVSGLAASAVRAEPARHCGDCHRPPRQRRRPMPRRPARMSSRRHTALPPCPSG